MGTTELPAEVMLHPGHWPGRLWCGTFQHRWLMEGHTAPREFVSVADVCLRCRARRELIPTGTCLCGHGWLDHSPRCDCGCAGWM